jgi:hypothetical protein
VGGDQKKGWDDRMSRRRRMMEMKGRNEKEWDDRDEWEEWRRKMGR